MSLSGLLGGLKNETLFELGCRHNKWSNDIQPLLGDLNLNSFADIRTLNSLKGLIK